MQEIPDKIQKFILEQFAIANQRNISLDDLLLGSGIIDSMGILHIVTFIEGEFGITVVDEDFTPENFQSIRHITHLVQSKL